MQGKIIVSKKKFWNQQPAAPWLPDPEAAFPAGQM